MSYKRGIGLGINISQVQRLEPNRMGKIYELMDFYEHQPKSEFTLNINNQEHKINYVFAPQSFLNYIKGSTEPFGASIGDMIFINSKLQENNPNWIPYIVGKLYAEKHIDPGLDESGKAVHWEALSRTIRVAGAKMNQRELVDFLEQTKEYETTGYFEFDGEVKEFLDRYGGDPTKAKREYLERHHGNRWVRSGRLEEQLNSIGFKNSAFQNGAEAVMTSLSGLEKGVLYYASDFIQQMARVDPGTPVIITEHFIPIAYAMTSDVNGKTDLVKFCNYGTPKKGEDIIVKTPGKQQTWTALGKRVSYNIHKQEQQVRNMITQNSLGLDLILIDTNNLNHQVQQQLIESKNYLTNPTAVNFNEVMQQLATLGQSYRQKLEEMNKSSQAIVQNIANLEDLSNFLISRI